MPEAEQVHLSAMRSIVAQLDGTPYVLKGGGALVLGRGLLRVTTDLDFDSTKPLNLRSRIEDAFKHAGIVITECKLIKDTPVTQRYRIVYLDHHQRPQRLKIETKLHHQIDLSTVEQSNGVSIYKLNVQMAQKLSAADDRGGLAPRDIYDIAFLAKEHPSSLHGSNLKHFLSFASDISKLDHTYRASWSMDPTLAEYDFEATVLTLGTIAQTIMVPNPDRAADQVKALALAVKKGLLPSDAAATIALDVCGINKMDAQASNLALRCVLGGYPNLIEELFSLKSKSIGRGI